MVITPLHGNWVDLVILVILAFYAIEGFKRGFWAPFFELVVFLGLIITALRFYPIAAAFLISNFSLTNSFANAIGFLIVAGAFQIVLSSLASAIIKSIPPRFVNEMWQKPLGIIPSVLNGFIMIAFLLTILIALPLKPQLKSDVQKSKIGRYMLEQTVKIEHELAQVFGGALRDTLTMLTIEPQSKERINLPISPQELKVDESLEQQMFALVNQERVEQGVMPLVWDTKIVVAARAHSKDMWQRHYFSHVDPDGHDPGDRLTAAGIPFTIAGENIAIAPTLELAHQGLMSSEGHRRNILDPRFHKIGIGIIDGGVYGKMFTQNFTD